MHRFIIKAVDIVCKRQSFGDALVGILVRAQYWMSNTTFFVLRLFIVRRHDMGFLSLHQINTFICNTVV
jgi:hypothetical protein